MRELATIDVLLIPYEQTVPGIKRGIRRDIHTGSIDIHQRSTKHSRPSGGVHDASAFILPGRRLDVWTFGMYIHGVRVASRYRTGAGKLHYAGARAWIAERTTCAERPWIYSYANVTLLTPRSSFTFALIMNPNT